MHTLLSSTKGPVRGLYFCMASVCAVAITGAGLLKLVDLPSFEKSLATWSLLPTGLIPLAVASVPILEVSAGLAFLLGVQRRTSSLIMIGLLVVFSLFYLAQSLLVAPPSCGCFGKLRLFEEGKAAALETAVRNMLLIFLLVPWILSERRHRNGPALKRLQPS